MAKRKKLPINEMTDRQIRHVEQLLFEGNPLGGRSLQDLLQKYAEEGPFTPWRWELIKHLRRCADDLIAMDTYIVMRGHIRPQENERADRRYADKRQRSKKGAV